MWSVLRLEILQKCESPCHLFQIFKTQFLKPPSMIIYDNACCLHQYCLNKELLKEYLDRFYYVDCSVRYNLDEYITMSMHNEHERTG